MIRYLILCLLIILGLSCKNIYYDTTETVVDRKKATSMINGLKKGTLVIQLPVEKRKLELLEKKAQNESDPTKKELYSKEFNNYKLYLNFIQTSIIEAATQEYKFSNYVFLPDSSVLAFKNGQRKNILINKSLEYVNDVDIDKSELVLFLRGQRYYDFLYIHNWDGSYPPEPFPYYTSMLSIFSPPNSFETLDWLKILDWKKLFYEAFANLNFKLDKFYDKHKDVQ